MNNKSIILTVSFLSYFLVSNIFCSQQDKSSVTFKKFSQFVENNLSRLKEITRESGSWESVMEQQIYWDILPTRLWTCEKDDFWQHIATLKGMIKEDSSESSTNCDSPMQPE